MTNFGIITLKIALNGKSIFCAELNYRKFCLHYFRLWQVNITYEFAKTAA